MKARHRCEIMFISRIFHVIVVSGMKFDTKQEHDEMIRVAHDAVCESTDDLCDKDKEVIRRRVQRMEYLTLKPACQKSLSERILLIGYYFMQLLIDREYIEFPEGSRLARITDYLFSLIDLDDKITQLRLDNTQKQARRWMRILQEQGYYQ